MIWIIIIVLVGVVILVSKVKQETSELEEVPFASKYEILLDGLNHNLFRGEAVYNMKDVRLHYLILKSTGRYAHIQFINRKNTLFLEYFDDLVGIKQTFSFSYTGTKDITREKQEFIAEHFSERVRKEAKVFR